ncbi:MAG: hypothetical protein LBV71_17925 [Prevotella sp.]|jgi:hypothetical protein|nr:hypothetical protein [Prevotella sp.]
MKLKIDAITEADYQVLNGCIPKYYGKDNYVSLDKKYRLGLTYMGEYRFGDAFYYGKIINTESNETVWEHNKGDYIRAISNYPWSIDSKTCYFSLVEKGNQIVFVDMDSGKMEMIYSGNYTERRLNWISFIPESFLGIIFYSCLYKSDNINEYEYYCYLKKTDELILLNDFCSFQIAGVAESPLENCLFIFSSNAIYNFNMQKREPELVLELESDKQLLSQRSSISLIKNKKLLLVSLLDSSKEWVYHTIKLSDYETNI